MPGRLPIQFTKLPHYAGPDELIPATEGSVGIDLIASIPETILLNTLGARSVIPTGICLALPENFEAQIRPRSGLAAKFGITLLNSPGTIDSDYRGEIFATLVNLSTNRFKVEPGMRIAQMVIAGPLPLVRFDAVDELSKTERGTGRHGSTGLF
ncbi:UNVERIFIED_CONTAM: hypothetical protein GTU68_053662 [Idotea baltica]|nr:hypothetical protein [Idotea baltica]